MDLNKGRIDRLERYYKVRSDSKSGTIQFVHQNKSIPDT